MLSSARVDWGTRGSSVVGEVGSRYVASMFMVMSSSAVERVLSLVWTFVRGCWE